MLAGVSVAMCATSAQKEPTTPGFGRTVLCSPSSFPIIELYFYTVMIAWFFKLLFSRKARLLSYPGRRAEFWSQVFQISKCIIIQLGN